MDVSRLRLRAGLSDLSGGITASIITLPKAMAYGALAFVPLGPQYIPLGLMAGILSLAFGNLVYLRGGSPILVNSTLSLASMLLAATLTGMLERLSHLAPAERDALALALLFFVVFLAGAIQFLAGLLRLGGLASYIPRQVISGLVNGVSVLIFSAQIPLLLNLPREVSLADPAAIWQHWSWSSLLVGLATIVAILFGGRLVPRIPPVFTGIALGCGVFYLLGWLTGDAPGPMLGTLASGLPLPVYAAQFTTLLPAFLEHAAFLLPYAFGVAAITALWSLLFMASADSLQGGKSDGNRELLGQGLGNMLLSLFGGVSVAGNSNTLVNYHNGGRSGLSRMACGLFALAVLLFLGPFISHIPYVVLAACLVVFSIQAIDTWSLRMARIAFHWSEEAREAWPDLAVMFLVMGTLLFFGVLEAVTAGIGISLVMFIRRMGQEVIRNDSDGRELSAHVLRPDAERALLREQGARIRVVELEGALFFGTADRVASHLRTLDAAEVGYIILDLRRITEVDVTGAEMLLKANRDCEKAGQVLLLSGIDLREADNIFLKRIGTLAAFDGRHFIHLNDALSLAEDTLLAEHLGSERYQREIDFAELSVFRDLSAGEVAALRAHFESLEPSDGESIFREGEAADAVYLLAKGRVNIRMQQAGTHDRTVRELCPGYLFGELALLRDRQRYGSAYARGEVRCYRLSRESLLRLQAEQPSLAFKFLAGMTAEMSDRLGSAVRASASRLYL